MTAVAVRAVRSEEAAMLREVQQGLAAAAEHLAAEIERREGAAAALLQRASLEGDGATLAREIARVAPPFSDVIVLSDTGAVVHPALPIRDREGVSDECARLARRYGELAGAERQEARAQILATCRAVRGPSGRWLWPMVAMEAESIDAPALERWVRERGAAMRPSERAALAEEVRRGPRLEADVKERLSDGLVATSPRVDALLGALDEGLARDLARAAPVLGATGRHAGSKSFGYVRLLPDGRRAGFVAHQASLASFVATLASPEDVRFGLQTDEGSDGVLIGRHARAEPSALDAARTPSAEVALTTSLRLRATPRDLGALALRTSRSKAMVLSVAAIAMGAAVLLAAWLFARMRAARRLGDLRTDFVAAVSHELRTPVASIRMLAELLDQGKIEPAEAREVHSALANEARRLGDTVQRLLGFGAMGRGRLTSSPKCVDVSAVLADAITTFEGDHPAIPKVVRAIDDGVLGHVDAALLRIALVNLLGNAAKYAPSGTPYRVTLREEPEALYVSVADRGPGIAPRDHRRVFEPFERARDRLSEATEGSGIGLSLVRYIAKVHGGDVSLESAPGRGATFTLRLPRRRDAAPGDGEAMRRLEEKGAS
jgi:two-component system phosphate regulon sensor histidine kinase PhoR